MPHILHEVQLRLFPGEVPMADLLETKRIALGQIVFCQGCCCGRTDRGRPELPVEKIKAIWREEKLNKSIQLSISGCLGPCDLANVALIMGPGLEVWVGGMNGIPVYDSLISWAREVHQKQTLTPLPDPILALRFQRFGVECVVPNSNFRSGNNPDV